MPTGALRDLGALQADAVVNADSPRRPCADADPATSRADARVGRHRDCRISDRLRTGPAPGLCAS